MLIFDPEDVMTTDPPAATPASARELAYRDRILGLEARLEECSLERLLTPSETLRAEDELRLLRASTTLRIGRIVLSPLRVIRRVLGRR
jgi:hypothetical protein